MRRLTVVLGVLALLGLLAPPAAAVPPFDVPGQITEQAGVGLDTSRVQDALEELREANGTQLFVVFVDSFDGQVGKGWADATAEVSGLGGNDVLLAIATGDRRYGVSVDAGFELSDQEIETILTEDVEPRLADDDWTGAAVALADGLRAAMSESPIVLDSGPLRMTASVGVAAWERETVDQLLGRADQALYEAKAAGRDRVVAAPGLGPLVSRVA